MNENKKNKPFSIFELELIQEFRKLNKNLDEIKTQITLINEK
ncbi:MAG: hypothetical protein ACOCXG_05840 [Nanoarchaeota archaeon]